MNASGALRLLVVMAVLATASLVMLWAQEATPPDEPEGITEDEDRARIQWADDLRYDAAEGMFYLSGHVEFWHKYIKLYCDEAEYDKDADRAVARGNPRVVNPDTTVTGDIIEANFDDEVATISGNVTAVTQRKKKTDEQAAEEGDGDDDDVPRDADEVWEKLTTITCPKVVYRFGDDVKTAHATGRVKAVQEDKTLYADEALYEELEDIITLTGDVRVVTERGDEFRCPKAVISVEEDWLQAEAVTGVAVRRDDEDEEE